MEWYRLVVSGVKNHIIRKFMKNFNSYQEVLKLDGAQLSKYYSLSDGDVKKILDSYKLDLGRGMEVLEKNRIKLLSLKDEEYPFFLKNISSPPPFLYVKGRGEFSQKSIGVVGTRKMTSYGQSACDRITTDLVDAGVTTVSGLALGVDAACHKKTMEKGGNTIAVVGNGLDVIYPSENRKIWERMEKEGTIVSEFPLGTRPNTYNFPMRNRIIMGLSKGVVVIESMKKGGSLITARLAIDEGRDVFAVPGDVFSPSSEGCNNLIKNSEAKLITLGEDILKEYGWASEGVKEFNLSRSLNLSQKENKVFEALKKEMNLDEIILETRIGAGELLAILMELELKELVCGAPGGRYRRKVLR